MRRLIATLALVAGMVLPASLSDVAASPSVAQADPSIGPNARDEARHAHDPLQLQPATSTVQPRQPRSAAPLGQPLSPLGSAINPAGGVDREVLGFAPYWAIPNNAQWNYSLLTTVAYFGLDINADGSISTTTSGWTGWNSQNLVNTSTPPTPPGIGRSW